jgi:hypothetical protein
VQHAIEWSRHVRERRDVVPHELESVAAEEVREVVGIAGDEVVESDDGVTVGEEPVGEV